MPRAPRAAHGAVARAERAEPRWRDIQWIDFTSDPDSAMLATPEPTPAPPLAAAKAAQSGVPKRGDALRHFAKRPAASSGGSNVIPGLAARFTRLPVPRVLPTQLPAAPPGIARLAAMPKTGSVVFHPRIPAPLAAIPEPPLTAAKPELTSPEVEPPPVAAIAKLEPNPPPALELSPVVALAPGPAAFDEEDGRPIPASFLTPTSTAPPEPATPFTAMLAARVAQAGTTLRGKPGAAAAAMNGSLARARTALRWRSPPQTDEALPEPEPPLPAGIDPAAEAASAAGLESGPPRSRLSFSFPARLAGSVAALAGRLAKAENRLRLSATITLAAILVALGAYIGGALLAALAGAGADTGHPAPGQPIHTAQAAAPAPPPASAPVPAVPPNDPAARAEFYLARAKAGDVTAQYDVGVLYARGEGLVQDYASAASWFHAAAAQGNVAAEYNLGVLYERGLGVAGDQTEALNWYRSAADRNYAGAQFNLALAYAEGRGTKQDFAAAARWYQRAAGQGLAPAMVNLAILYERGDGVDRSLADAYAWYSAAGERGDAGAKQRASDLFQQFNDKDKARAEGLAATIGAALDASAPPA